MFPSIKNIFKKLFLQRIIFTHQLKLGAIILITFFAICFSITTAQLWLFQQQKLSQLDNLESTPAATSSPQTEAVDLHTPTPTPVFTPIPTPDLTQEIIISSTTSMYQENNLVSPWYEKYFFNTDNETNPLKGVMEGFVDKNRSQKLDQIISQKMESEGCRGFTIVRSSFANILSLELGNCNYFLNLRLDTMEEISFSDLWLPGVDSQAMIKLAIKEAFFDDKVPDQGDWEAAYLDALEKYAQINQVPTGSFAIENTQVWFPLPTELRWSGGYLNNFEHFTIPFADYRDRATVYRKFLTQKPLFSTPPAKFAYVFYDFPSSSYYSLQENGGNVHHTQSQNGVYYLIHTPPSLALDNIQNQFLKNAIADQLDYLQKHIDEQLSALPVGPNEITVVDISLYKGNAAYHHDELLNKQINNTFAVAASLHNSLKIPKVIDGLSVVERLDWAFSQLQENKFDFHKGNIEISTSGKVFDQNGQDVSENYCFLADSDDYMFKNSDAVANMYGDYHADQNCNITKVQ